MSILDPVSVDDIIHRLLTEGRGKINNNLIRPQEMYWLIEQVTAIFKKQPICLELMPPVTICGDIHGQYHDLLRLFEAGGSPAITNYLFLGDYVDRGNSSLNTICLLFAYKIKYPQNFFLLRGNHEDKDVNREYGFLRECYETHSHDKLYKAFNKCFNWLPISAIIDGRVLCIHGGICPNLKYVSQLKEIRRPYKLSKQEFILDLLWSDPDKKTDEFEDNIDRGLSYLFGKSPVQKFLHDNDLDLIVRGHQAVDLGYDFPYAPDMSIVTVFSAPNYCGDFGNDAALLEIDNDLNCSFKTVVPLEDNSDHGVCKRANHAFD
ncbi:Serine/threonine protein phosphatase PP1-gamma catalytic subunit, putative [Trichomonas vaginalis G3]|uniref:Serine/threonine-protein phosphatase n=1 Tax=Trichomonas vaginalis (strain ATCC PRA-98 / G3) TaxID=412133 RepID=A2ER98_TRIV3|nr:phosphoprotein phosphatase protein [Trichomonas vaginalis G3]EAY04851.1 Serine/threonine protein phosphatase PP1-gamma catalytic subunit, putative [Trichomonas vaginalis G3]KAI5535373.1 phosphoprotein phosphatase protein [Trichomonas vaginalis G3]|eukprot:XP_001317074.1 Serine/threonine protein phosphatase PP1-gamma catalytic subunit [Trichomonas vaginalis G3]